MKKIAGSMAGCQNVTAEEFSAKATEIIKTDDKLRQQMLSIGLVVLMPDGKHYLRGSDVKIPVRRGVDELDLTPENVEQWCFEGWVDLRVSNFVGWKERMDRIISEAESIPVSETGSRYTYTRDYWDNFKTIDEGKIAGWIFEYEDKGWRFKR